MKNKENLLTLTDKNFNHQALENHQPVLVHFRANWSGASDIMAPIIEDLALKFSDEVRFGEIDIEKNNQIAERFDVERIPSLLFFSRGEVVDRLAGVISKSELTDRLKALLEKGD